MGMTNVKVYGGKVHGMDAKTGGAACGEDRRGLAKATSLVSDPITCGRPACKKLAPVEAPAPVEIPTALQSLVTELQDMAAAHEAKIQAVKDIPSHLTDEALQTRVDGGGGFGRAAGYLLRLPADLRASAESEGTIMHNTTPGWRYADAIGRVVRSFLDGNTSTPLMDWNRQIMAQEREAQAARLATLKAVL